MKGRLTSPTDIRYFLEGGKASFTIVGQQARYTFRILYNKWVYLMTSPGEYNYLAVKDQNLVFTTKASRLKDDARPVKALAWLVRRVYADKPIEPAEFWHEGKCARCGRALTTPESIARGYGPTCWEGVDGTSP